MVQAIYSRRSVREFTSDAVDESVLRRLIDAAIQAPSAVNEQPWSFVVVRDRELLSRISRDAKAFMLAAPPEHALPEHLRAILSDPQFHIFYHAPALIVISSATGSPWAIENCALAAQNLMLAACAESLGTCWIGFAQRWLGTPPGRAAIGLPASYEPVAPIIVGHPKSTPHPVPRKPADIRWLDQ